MADERAPRREWVIPAFTLAVGIFAAAITAGAQYWTHPGEVDLKTIEIDIDILCAPPGEDVVAIRSWAMDLIEEKTGRTFSTTERQALQHNQFPSVPLAAFSANHMVRLSYRREDDRS